MYFFYFVEFKMNFNCKFVKIPRLQNVVCLVKIIRINSTYHTLNQYCENIFQGFKKHLMKNLKLTFLILAIGIFLYSCGANSDSNSNNNTSTLNTTNYTDSENPQITDSEKVIKTVDFKPFQEKDQIYAWVDKLNIRNEASLEGKVIAAVNSDDALEFTGTKSGKAKTIVLRGVAYNDLFYKVVTKEGQEGWVYGGAVKRKGEKKGNTSITDTKFDFPYFGSYDLSNWEKISTKSEGEEIDLTVTLYQKGDQFLEITKADRGEFYYGYDYKLMDENKTTLKERNFSFSADMDLREITEMVKDYTKKPAQQYLRSQKIDVHFYQLKPRPVMALGNFTVKPLEISSVSKNNSSNPVSIHTLNYSDCNIPDKDSGCNCNFRPSKDFKEGDIFMTNFGKDGCITIDDETFALNGDFVQNGFDNLFNNSEKEIWVELNEKGDDLLFGEKMDIGGDYEEEKSKLYKTLLVMSKLPKVLPMKINGTVGMGHQGNVKDLFKDALQMAISTREKGDFGILKRMKYINEKYEVLISARVLGRDDGGGIKYEGTLELLDKSGNKLASKKVWGGCGC